MEFTIVLIAVIVLVGAFVQGLTGFGLALVSVPLLSLVVDAKTAVPIAATFGWLVTIPLAWQLRSHIHHRFALLLFVGSVPASIFGARLLSSLPSSYILGAMGVVLIMTGVYTLMDPAVAMTSASTGTTLVAGFGSGMLGASVGEPGPPAIAYISMQSWNADETKATLSFFFMLQMMGALASFWNEGLFDEEVIRSITWSLGTFVVGLALGMIGYQRLGDRNIDYHKLVHVLVVVMGIVLLVRTQASGS